MLCGQNSVPLNWIRLHWIESKRELNTWMTPGGGSCEDSGCLCKCCQPVFIQFSIIVPDYHTVIDYQSYTLSLYFFAVRVSLFSLLCICCSFAPQSTSGGRALFRSPLLSPWLGGVRLKGNCCALSIRWNYRCVRGCALSLRHSCQSWGHFRRVWAPWLCFAWTWWGIFDSGSAVGKQTRTRLGSGTIFLPSSLLSPSCTERFSTRRDFPEDMAASDRAVYWKVDAFIWPFIQGVHPPAGAERLSVGECVKCTGVVASAWKQRAFSRFRFCPVCSTKAARGCLQAAGGTFISSSKIIGPSLWYGGRLIWFLFARLRSRSAACSSIGNISIH